MDNVRYYTRELSINEIQAEAASAWGSVQPDAVSLGCQDCTLAVASTSCISGYHLCTTVEIHAYGFQVATAQGWLTQGNIWSYNALADQESSEEGSEEEEGADTGLGLCCIN